ncbi:RNA polymerase sigma factor [Chitinophaga nivalis]|uniref:Sigma-70 family RNA polymerase sigma factor n=1 Tax=Chitinophaga nivalis TaxID=2991709 RepID=A0ABT3II52_9BACT|nr:sigma-70 family RNA polymerase sigma factor [Chitinophaga nivalis]MCW3466672.1 sigma-70 family RNA polymerase sigma factor [Chitinophaga nivalis]MCW3483637.1 sigma-70 family RNA polymerase sigma factor [Chitinophaga nivalis]
MNAQSLLYEGSSEKYFQLFKQGCQEGFSHIWRMLYRPVFNFARRIISDEFEIESIVQDAFLLIWERREIMENIEHVRGYIRQRVKWNCYSYLNSANTKRMQKLIPLDFYEDNGIVLAISDPWQEDCLQGAMLREEEQRQQLEKAIAYLPPNEKMIASLQLQGYRVEDIAARIGQPCKDVGREQKRIGRTLKPIVDRLKNVAGAIENTPMLSVRDYAVYLSPLQIELFKLRYEKKYDFTQISIEMNLNKWDVVKMHLLIMRKINRAKNAKGKMHRRS